MRSKKGQLANDWQLSNIAVGLFGITYTNFVLAESNIILIQNTRKMKKLNMQIHSWIHCKNGKFICAADEINRRKLFYGQDLLHIGEAV